MSYLPDFTAVLMALSAWLKPSAEPRPRKQSEWPGPSCLPKPRSPAELGALLTDGDGGDLRVLLSCQVFHVPAGVIPRHRAHEDRSVGLHLKAQMWAWLSCEAH